MSRLGTDLYTVAIVLPQAERRKLAEIIRRDQDFSCFPGIPNPCDWLKAFSLTTVGLVY
jgi:hypothetical protein